MNIYNSGVGKYYAIHKVQGRVYEKIKIVKNLTDPTGWPGNTRSKTRLQPVDYLFLFFTKTMSFWFIKKIGVNPGDPIKTQGPGLKTLLIIVEGEGNEEHTCRWSRW
jgi:hypothetical protein